MTLHLALRSQLTISQSKATGSDEEHRLTRDGASSEYGIKEQIHCNFNQYHNIQHRQAMGRMTEILFAVRKRFFLWRSTKPVFTDSLASCQTHTISFPGGKDTLLLSSPISLYGNEIVDVWSFTPNALRTWVPNPRPVATFENYIYCKNYTLT